MTTALARPLRAGLELVPDGTGGGIYQYSQALEVAFRTWARESTANEVVLFGASSNCGDAAENRVVRRSIQPPSVRRTIVQAAEGVPGARSTLSLLRQIRHRQQPHPAAPRGDSPVRNGTLPAQDGWVPLFDKWFQTCGMDLMLYAFPTTLAWRSSIPSIAAIHDLQHRLNGHFPEVSADGEWERREHLFRGIARHSLFVLVDSEVGKEDILDNYEEHGLSPDRVKVVPFVPAPYLQASASPQAVAGARAKYDLESSYLFYPAQFWPHKNHLRIVEALGILKQRGQEIPLLALSGSKLGPLRESTYEEVMMRARELGILDCVRYLGYVAEDDMAGLYGGAFALVMPTFFGPTNIPVLEAWAMGCPVMTSDIRGIREQVGRAGVLVDPTSAEAIAEGIERLDRDQELRERIVAEGHRRLREYGPSDFNRRIADVLEEARERILTGSSVLPLHPRPLLAWLNADSWEKRRR